MISFGHKIGTMVPSWLIYSMYHSCWHCICMESSRCTI